MRWVPLLLLAACDCSSAPGPSAGPVATQEPVDDDDVAWEEVGRRVGADVPSPGAPPSLRPLARRESRDLTATPRVSFEGPYVSVHLGSPPLAVRSDTGPDEGEQVFRYTLVALEEDGPRDLLTLARRPREVVRSGDHVYVAADALHRVDLSDGSTVQLTTEPVRALAAGPTHVYFVSGGGAILGDPPSTLHRIPKGGGEPEVLYRDLPFIDRLAVHGDRLLWVAKMRPRRLMDLPPGYFTTAPADGSAPPAQQTFASQRPTDVVVDDEAAYILTEGTLGRSLNGSFNDGLVLRRDHDATEWVTLADRQPMPGSLVQDDTHLCWVTSENAGEHVRCVPKAGGPVLDVTELAAGRATLSLRDGVLAWCDPTGARVLSVELP